MWNYGYAIHSLFILFIILLFYFSLPRLSVKINRTFLYLLWVESAVLFFDIVASWADSNISEVSLPVAHLLNVCYFASFFCRALAFFEFISIVFKRNYASNRAVLALVCVPFGAGFMFSLLSPWTGLIYNLDGGQYHNGPYYFLLYYVSYFYIAFSFYITLKYKNTVRRRYFFTMLFYNAVLLAGVIFRKIFPTYLLMDSFFLMALITAYLTFGNPEFYLETRGKIFNSNAFRDYFEENNGKLKHKILGIVIHNYMEMRDIYGGRQLDQGLILISQYLLTAFPEYDAFYYRNGRFFLVSDKEMPLEKAVEVIRERFKNPWVSENLEIYLEVAFCGALVNGKVASSDFLLSTLMDAMEKADKGDLKETVVVTEKELNEYVYKAALKKNLEYAVEHDKVEVFFQPFIEAKSGRLVGAEALARIRDEKGNIIPPGLFIPVAEANGRINDLGEQIFEKACKFASNYNMTDMGMKWVSVNLSPAQFIKRDLAERYASIVEKYGVDPEKIHLEITEVSLADESVMNKQVQAMIEKGFKFALDDYGTGSSNLARIKKYPFVDIKIDMSVVWDYCKNPDDLLPSMISTFERMGFKTTCEGIEDDKMRKIVTELGADYLQGYYYSKPIPMDEFIKKYSSCNLPGNPI